MKSKISSLQFSVLLGISSMGFITLYHDAISCFSMVISTLISFLLLIPLLVISNKEKYNIPVVFRILSILFVSLLSTLLINRYSVFFTSLINPVTPKWIISGLLLLALAFPAIKGIEAVSRGALIVSFFVVLSLLLIFIFVPYGDMNYFTDNDNSFSISDGIDTLLAFSPMILSLFFFRNINSGRARSIIFPFAISSFVILISMCFIKLLSISEYNYVFYALSEVSCKKIPMGFSGLFIVLSLICVFFALLYFTLTIKSAMKSNSRLITVIYLILVYCLSLGTLYSQDIYNFLLNKYFLLALYVVLALFTPIAVIVKDKYDKNRESYPQGNAEDLEEEND